MRQSEKANIESIHEDAPKGSETPFFARFLEGQHNEDNPRAANDEAVFMTLKYPSDRDEPDSPAI
ncbi:MAG TPA: microviridin/marinostatin family tricyclic proteinase inhibitor [Pyrinomonadaceae bacterium]|nr:microviridin/marinostatin family tricyclic proteinase inhibitor [Pyrinomonadaceae bacterium]